MSKRPPRSRAPLDVQRPLDMAPPHEPQDEPPTGATGGFSVRVRAFEVSVNYDGWRLDRFLEQKIGRFTRAQARKAIQAETVCVVPSPRAIRSTKLKPGLILRTGDVVHVSQEMRAELIQDAEVALLAESPRFLVFNKPAGMLMHPTASEYLNTLLAYVERQVALGRPWSGAELVHRLDRETSGAVLMARGLEAQRAFSARFENNEIKKLYLAVVDDPEGRYVVGQVGEIAQSLGFEAQTRLQGIKVGVGDWPARTRWRCVDRAGSLAALQVEIEGGRQHQIRVHMAMLKTPIVGDKLYAHGEAFFLAYLENQADMSLLRAPRQALHAWRLSFEDQGAHFSVCAPVPALFSDLLQKSDPWDAPDF